LRARDHEKVTSLSRAFWRQGLPGLGLADEVASIGEATIVLDAFPTLDETWCAFMLASCERVPGAAPPARWEAMVRYVEGARLGYLLDKVEPERAILPLYQAIIDQHLVHEPADRETFIEDALALCARIDERLEGGADLLCDEHFSDDARFTRYLAMLEADRALYREDVARAQRFMAELPANKGQAARSAALLVLDRPASSQFKVWARRDPEAPGGEGYALMLVRKADSVVISADPLKRIKLDWITDGLTELEGANGVEGDEPSRLRSWYDGARHEGTLVASPREGTNLDLEEILGHLTTALKLVPAPPKTKPSEEPSGPLEPRQGARPNGWMVAGIAGVLAVVAVWIVRPPAPPTTQGTVVASVSAPVAGVASSDRARERDTTPEDKPRLRAGAKGDPLPDAKVKEVAQASSGRPKYALVAGACSYTGDKLLLSPCRDASAVRKLLIEHYGYSADNIIYLVDKSSPGEKSDGKATARNMKRQVERFRERFGDHPDSSFLFYYSGHGGYISGAHEDYGVLQPTGFFDKYASEPYSNRGWDMQSLMDDIKKGVPSRHLMLVIDACYSGWAGAKGDGDLDDKVRSLWNERAEVILSAASKGQRAWEDEQSERAWVWNGHSALTAFMLRALERGEGGAANADGNKDGIVTDEELAGYLKEAVSESVALNKSDSKQTPQFFRLDERLAKSGQFLFVPRN
jgi:hypothetical protein